MEQFNRLSPTERDNLVAYLDGELDEQATGVIEAALSESPVARREVDFLSRTYDLLDSLPRVRATDEFTERTIATVRLEEADSTARRAEWLRRVKRYVFYAACAATVLAASFLGYASAHYVLTRERRQLVENYELIRNLDKYRQVRDVELLERLANEPGLREEMREVLGNDNQ